MHTLESKILKSGDCNDFHKKVMYGFQKRAKRISAKLSKVVFHPETGGICAQAG